MRCFHKLGYQDSNLEQRARDRPAGTAASNSSNEPAWVRGGGRGLGVNEVGVWSTEERHNWFDDDHETILHWRERPSVQHIELGIAEVNLVGLISELGRTWSRRGETLFPIGTIYDPFVERALEPSDRD